MSDTRAATIAEIINAQRSVTRALSASSSQDWMQLDFSMPQLKTLMTLSSAEALSIGQIADILGVGQPTASHLIDRLVQSDLVIRMEDPEDRRRTLATLSPQGVRLIERLRQISIELLQRWLTCLDDPSLAALQMGFRALAAVASADTTGE